MADRQVLEEMLMRANIEFVSTKDEKNNFIQMKVPHYVGLSEIFEFDNNDNLTNVEPPERE